jgi:stress response protein YsnF
VERRPVNQPAASLGVGAFKEGVIEITETDEEAVVAKEARVVEEVVVSKDVTERQEVVRDTAGRADVEVQRLDAGAPSGPDRAAPEDQKRRP